MWDARMKWTTLRKSMKMLAKLLGLSTWTKFTSQYWLSIWRPSFEFWSREWSKNNLRWIIVGIRPIWGVNSITLHAVLFRGTISLSIIRLRHYSSSRSARSLIYLIAIVPRRLTIGYNTERTFFHVKTGLLYKAV